MEELDNLNDAEERVLMFLWIEPSITHLHKNLEPYANPEQIDAALETLIAKGFINRTRRNAYSIPLKVRRKYTYEPASLCNGGYARLVPVEKKATARPTKKRKRS
jgi:hypothetical protein